jgi:hypothetical protein
VDRLVALPVSCFITSSATGPLFFRFSRVSLLDSSRVGKSGKELLPFGTYLSRGVVSFCELVTLLTRNSDGGGNVHFGERL